MSSMSILPEDVILNHTVHRKPLFSVLKKFGKYDKL